MLFHPDWFSYKETLFRQIQILFLAILSDNTVNRA